MLEMKIWFCQANIGMPCPRKRFIIQGKETWHDNVQNPNSFDGRSDTENHSGHQTATVCGISSKWPGEVAGLNLLCIYWWDHHQPWGELGQIGNEELGWCRFEPET